MSPADPDIGSGLPTAPSLHEAGAAATNQMLRSSGAVAPDTWMVYVVTICS
jgi:hypothetical protein